MAARQLSLFDDGRSSDDRSDAGRAAVELAVGSAAIDEPLVEYRVHADQVSLTQVRQQAVECVAAFEADARRTRGLPDPFSATSLPVTAADLERLGVSPSHLDDIVAAHVHGRHELLLATGMTAQARALLDGFLGTTAATPLTSRRRAYRLLMCGRQARHEGRLLEKTARVLQGGAALPGAVPWLASQIVQRRLRR